MLTNIQRISLQIMTVNPRCEHVQSCHGVPVTLSGVVHCKIMSTAEFLPLAAEQFLGKSIEQIKSIILQTVEGHMRAIICTLPIEELSSDRKKVADLVREVATKDLSRMGIDIMSLTIKDIKDDVEYLSSAGKKKAAEIKFKAAINAAEAEGNAAKEEAKLADEIKRKQLENDAKLAKLNHDLEMAKATQDEKISVRKAEAMREYDYQISCLQSNIRRQEMEIKEEEYKGLIEIQRKENERRQTELEMEIELPTEAQIYELNKQTEAIEFKNRLKAAAEEFRIKTEGEAQARASKLEGLAEAEGMKKVAEARRNFNEAAILYDMLNVLPDVAAEVATPLNKFDEIVLLSDNSRHIDDKSSDRKAIEAARLNSAVPYAIKAVGGADKLSGNLLSSLMHLQKSAS